MHEREIPGGSMELQVNRTDFHQTRVVDEPPAALEPGQARLAIGRFAFTANNITYVAMGDFMRYWDFFPAESPWGIPPVWGFADVVESRHDEVAVGTRVFGFLPLATELVITVGKVDAGGFTDGATHRAELAAVYNRYALADPAVEVGSVGEDRQMVLYPLFVTSFLVDDFLEDNDDFGAERVIVSSASSKTALGVAQRASQRDGLQVVGLTSPANAEFVRGLGVYDVVLGYDELDQLPVGTAVYVDVTGSGAVRAAVHEHYGEDLRHDMILGGTHWDQMGSSPGEMPGPRPAFFFAPSQVAKRNVEWGAEGLDRRLQDAWAEYADWAADWVDFHHSEGPEAATAVYLEVLDNRSDPRVGHIVTLASS
jgi:hypothetical protein